MVKRLDRLSGRACGLCLVLAIGCSVDVALAEQPAAQPGSYAGITRPSEERQLNFSFAGVVRKVNVKEGDTVKAGTVLMELDSRMDRKALEGVAVEANSTLKADYSKVEAAQKKVALKRIEELTKENAASPTELEEAQLAAELASKRVELTDEETLTKKIEAQRLAVKVELMQLPSTIDGIVQRVDVKEGEIADPGQTNRPACVVVKNDPLKVEVFLPTAVTGKLKKGQELEVQYPGSTDWEKAKITFFDPVADAGSGMRKLHLELPNPTQRESGWQVQVKVPENVK